VNYENLASNKQQLTKANILTFRLGGVLGYAKCWQIT